MKPHWRQPSHPQLIEVVSQPGSFSTYSKANSSFEAGAVLSRLAAPTLTLSERAYSSVQVGPIENIELNCDFLYINHSCEPNLEFHVIGSDLLSPEATEKDHPVAIEVRVARRRDAQGNLIGIQKGEELSFFYPSTEWDMSQAFECQCKTASCRGPIRGAKYLSREVMKEYFINEHVLKLKDAQEKGDGSSSRKWSGCLASGGSASPPTEQ